MQPNPLVLYLSNDIPFQYRSTVKAALLTWNDAFRRIGILDAVQVLQQPTDPSWDPEDIRHNMIRWINTSSPAFGAEALLVTDPRTGEELNIGVNFDAVEGLVGRTYRYVVAPARGLADTASAENMFTQTLIRSVILHESGHDFGLQHNFIGTMAYTAKQMQNKAFTSRYGVGNSVMEYAPINLWPKGTAQGDYFQLGLGPYDYYAIRYGYGYIPNASSPAAELPTLRRWASGWANPRTRFASDEDVSFQGGHADRPARCAERSHESPAPVVQRADEDHAQCHERSGQPVPGAGPFIRRGAPSLHCSIQLLSALRNDARALDRRRVYLAFGQGRSRRGPAADAGFSC